MKVFLSWSGERSKHVAELLNEWIVCVIQVVEPWISSKDIDRGSIWFSEITNQLADTSIGIICITQENKDKPWILFEAGALLKGLSENKVCTFLIDLLPQDITPPLSQFNHTLPDRDGIYRLVRTINSSLKGLSLKDDVLDRVFKTYWPQFEAAFKEIIESTPTAATEQPARKPDDILTELLNTVRGLEKRIRTTDYTDGTPTSKRQLKKNAMWSIGLAPNSTSSSSSLPKDMEESLRLIWGMEAGEVVELESGEMRVRGNVPIRGAADFQEFKAFVQECGWIVVRHPSYL